MIGVSKRDTRLVVCDEDTSLHGGLPHALVWFQAPLDLSSFALPSPPNSFKLIGYFFLSFLFIDCLFTMEGGNCCI